MAESTLNASDLSTLKVADLKRELKERNLPCSGNKTELLQRLQTHLESPPETDELSMEDTTIGLNDTGEMDAKLDISIDDSLLNDEKEAEQTTEASDSSKKTTVVTSKPERQKITMSDTPESTQNGHDTTKKTLTAEERLKLRQERFGVQSEQGKKQIRAERFGVPVTATTTAQKPGKIVNTPVTADDMEKLKKRAERFGTVVSTSLTKAANVEKLQQRSQRFGSSVAPAISKLESQEKLNKRKERFGAVTASTGEKISSDEVEAKKMKRAERFALK